MNRVWTDGACEPNPGSGGWGYMLITDKGLTREDCGGEAWTTNNRMELVAILHALRSLPAAAPVTVYSDSQYCVNGLTVWRRGWQRRAWHTKQGEPMPIRDLWLDLERELNRLRAAFEWVRGHNGNPGNERADALANIGRLHTLRAAA